MPLSLPQCHAPHVQGIAENNLPAELYPSYTTIEYTLPRTVQPHPPVYLFLIDTCVSEDELSACKTAILQVGAVTPCKGTKLWGALGLGHGLSTGAGTDCGGWGGIF